MMREETLEMLQVRKLKVMEEMEDSRKERDRLEWQMVLANQEYANEATICALLSNECAQKVAEQMRLIKETTLLYKEKEGRMEQAREGLRKSRWANNQAGVGRYMAEIDDACETLHAYKRKIAGCMKAIEEQWAIMDARLEFLIAKGEMIKKWERLLMETEEWSQRLKEELDFVSVG